MIKIGRILSLKETFLKEKETNLISQIVFFFFEYYNLILTAKLFNTEIMSRTFPNKAK